MTARVTSESKRFAEAEIVEFETRSPDRVAPPCRVFGECGGCTWQHVPYEMQWKTKRDGVIEALTRSGVKLPEAPIEEFPASHFYNYRNRIQLRARLSATDPSKTVMGFFGRGTRELVGIDRCEIAREELNAALADTKKEASRELARKTEAGDLRPEMKIEIEVLEDGSVRKSWDSRHGALGFRQVNDDENDRLRTYVREALTPGAHLLDLFGGDGNFSYDDAERYSGVECVDLGSPEVAYLDQPRHYHFFKSDVARWFDRRLKEKARGGFNPKGPVEAILDPPREGLAKAAEQIVRGLDSLGVRKIVAIGCDSDSWARDLSHLEKQGWKLEKWAAFDLFPQTPHVEAVGVLVRA